MVSKARRRVLKLIALASTVPVQAVRPARAQPVHSAMMHALIEMLDHHHSARVVGQAYLEARPADCDVVKLTGRIGSALGSRRSPEHLAANPEELRRALRETVLQDYSTGRWVSLNGWLVSETEGRLCALRCIA